MNEVWGPLLKILDPSGASDLDIPPAGSRARGRSWALLSYYVFFWWIIPNFLLTLWFYLNVYVLLPISCLIALQWVCGRRSPAQAYLPLPASVCYLALRLLRLGAQVSCHWHW
jgi:hypothetical protein